MPHTINWNKEGVEVKFRGLLRPEDILTVNDILYRDSRFDTINYQLYDFLEVDEVNGSEVDVELIGTIDKQISIWNNKFKGVILAKDPQLIELLSVYKELLEGTNWQIKIFKNIESANEWINS